MRGVDDGQDGLFSEDQTMNAPTVDRNATDSLGTRCHAVPNESVALTADGWEPFTLRVLSSLGA